MKIPISGDAEQFECVECKRTILMLAGVRVKGSPNLCAMCLCIPGWNRIAELRERMDPLHNAVWYDDPPEPGTLRYKLARGEK